MSRENQIDEMSVIMRDAYLKECIHPDCHNCEMFTHDARHNGLCKEKYRAEALYNAGYRKQEWISVDERLPEIEGTYLAYTSRRTIEIAHFYPYYVNGKPQFDYWITHWMPLPEAPKMKGGAE